MYDRGKKSRTYNDLGGPKFEVRREKDRIDTKKQGKC